MKDRSTYQPVARAIAAEILEDTITRTLNLHITPEDSLDILKFAYAQMTRCLASFDEMLNIRIESKPITYHEVEPTVGLKDRLARYSLKVIQVERPATPKLPFMKPRSRMMPAQETIIKKRTTRSFNIKSSVVRSSSRDHNKSGIDEKLKGGSARPMRAKVMLKQSGFNVATPQSKKVRFKKRTPEPECKVLDKEVKHRAPQFRLFYMRQESRHPTASHNSKDSEFKPIVDKFPGICSLDGGISFNESILIEQKPVISKDRFFATKKVMIKTPVTSELPDSRVARQNTGIKVFDKDKLRHLFFARP